MYSGGHHPEAYKNTSNTTTNVANINLSNHPYFQPRIPLNRAKSHEDVCLQKMAGLREQHSKSTQELMTQLNLAKELVGERVRIKETARRREDYNIGSATMNNYSSSADEVQQMRRQNRLGKTSLAAMKYLSSVDHRRSSSLLGVNTIIHKKKPVNCTENTQYQFVEEEVHEIPKQEEPIQKTLVVNINEKLGIHQRRSQTNLLNNPTEMKKI